MCVRRITYLKTLCTYPAINKLFIVNDTGLSDSNNVTSLQQKVQFVVRKVNQGATAKQIAAQVPNWGTEGKTVSDARILLLMQLAKSVRDPEVMRLWVQDQRSHSTGGLLNSPQKPLYSEELMRSLAFKKLPDVYKVRAFYMNILMSHFVLPAALSEMLITLCRGSIRSCRVSLTRPKHICTATH
jgi:hypothetical protein